ncbi:MAG TPA: hypothetical protein VFE25_15310 [Opitutaceae bacterium]|nr:hypothetical protein [Opitutaceae bacterium]
MSRSILSRLFILCAVLAAAAPSAFARVDSEVSTPDKRKLAVDKAVVEARQVKPPVLPKTLNVPFSPPNFDLSDAEEAAAAAAAARLANPNSPQSLQLSDHDLLVEIVAKVRPSGTIYVGGRPYLMFGSKFVKTGSHFTVTYKSQDYDLELTGIDGTNFTLRYRNEEITRPTQSAQPAKSP